MTDPSNFSASPSLAWRRLGLDRTSLFQPTPMHLEPSAPARVLSPHRAAGRAGSPNFTYKRAEHLRSDARMCLHQEARLTLGW